MTDLIFNVYDISYFKVELLIPSQITEELFS